MVLQAYTLVTDYFSIQGIPLGIFSLLRTDDLTLSSPVIGITSTTPSENCVSSVSQLVSTTRYSPSVFGPVSTAGGLDTVATILISALVVVLLVVMVSVSVCVLLIAKRRRSHHSPELHDKMWWILKQAKTKFLQVTNYIVMLTSHSTQLTLL